MKWVVKEKEEEGRVGYCQCCVNVNGLKWRRLLENEGKKKEV